MTAPRITAVQLEDAIGRFYDVAASRPRYRSVATLAAWVSIPDRAPVYTSLSVDGLVVRMSSLLGPAHYEARHRDREIDVFAWARAASDWPDDQPNRALPTLAVLYDHHSGNPSRRLVVDLSSDGWSVHQGSFTRWASLAMMPNRP